MNQKLARLAGIVVAGLLLACGALPAEAAGSSQKEVLPPSSAGPDLKAEATAQYQILVVQIANRAWFERDFVVAQAADPQSLILKEDRDPLDVVLRRTKALLADLKTRGPRYDLIGAEAALRTAEAKARNLPVVAIAPATPAQTGQSFPDRAVWSIFTPSPPAGPRYELFVQVCALRRQIALANPLLDFDRLLFIKRKNPLQGHMCLYPGGGGVGGGLFVLSDPFGTAPRLRNVLKDASRENGKPQDLDLARPTICSFDLSYDGRTILFAASVPESSKGVPAWFRFGRSQKTGHWSLFRVGADGSELLRLTDSPFNDFDPCFLPNGRVVFISERRGGYGRCHGEPFPTYTLHSMNADGGDVVCLSFHETNEWNPSVGNDGKIIFTRWDYVDRDTNVAHHVWECFPDGRDPRSFHGNYPVLPPEYKRETGMSRFGGRPWGEWGCRAVPGRDGQLVATAGAHHGAPTFGSLVLIDKAWEDDDVMSQVRRLTPEAPFPEAEGGPRSFGYAWPLSERYFLCAYDAESNGPRRSVNYGLYLVDAFGNKELLYRDAAVSSVFPMPLRARSAPPTIPAQTIQRAKGGSDSDLGTRPATVAVMNVYESDFPWPADTRIAALRLIQVLPKTTPIRENPRIGLAHGNGARAVLGTVPVESDGSAYFEAPPGKPFYFQALDERGLAVQSMRSVTYLQPGEQMTCLGCHEPKHRTFMPNRSPIALRRPPSKVQPGPDGSNPFSYVRLVQPVLDRHCAACHAEKKAIDLSDAPVKGWFTRSYGNLATKHGFWLDSHVGCFSDPRRGGSRTLAGRFGARASPLLALLDKGHHGLKLPSEDFHRLTLWLDCNSDFYGVYHNPEAQLRGEIVKPDLE
jgi:hypothetical protein